MRDYKYLANRRFTHKFGDYIADRCILLATLSAGLFALYVIYLRVAG